MRSFALSALASIAFSVFCSAAPTPNYLPVIEVRTPPVATPDAPATPDGAKTLQSVCDEATASLSALKAQVLALNTAQAVLENVDPIVRQLQVVVTTTVDGVKVLASMPSETVLQDVSTGVILDVTGIVNVVAPVVKGVLEIVVAVVTLVGSEVKTVILPLVLEILESLAELLTCVIQIVGDLAAEVIAGVLQVVKDLIPTVLDLSAGKLLDIFGVSH